MTNPFAAPGQPAAAPAGNPFAAPQSAPAAPPAPTPPAPPQQAAAAQPAAGGNPFRQPGSSSGGDFLSGDEWKSHAGRLVLFEPTELNSQIPTNNGPADAVTATVTIIDHMGEPLVLHDSLVFPRVLVSQLKGEIGAQVLGRLGLYDTKAGRQTVQLLEYTVADADMAGRYLTWRAQQQVSQPAQAQAAEPPY